MVERVAEGYKKTEVGVIPDEWECVKLGDIGESIIGLTYRPEDITENGLLVLRSSNIKENFLKYDDNVFVDVEVNERLIVKENDILICVRNGSRNLIGKCALVDKNAKGVTFGAFMSILRSKYGKFLFYYFQSNIIKKQIEQNIGATINQITNRDLNSFRVLLPKSESEQTAIAEALSDIDSLIFSIKKLIAKKQNIKQGALQELLTGRKRLSGFGGEWDVKTMDELFNFSGGFSASREQLSKDGYCYLHYGDIHGANKTFINVDREYISIPKLDIPLNKITKDKMLEHGDVVFVDASEDDEGTSKHIIVCNPKNIPYISGLHTIVSKSKDKTLSNEYKQFCFCSKDVKKQFKFYAVGTKVSGISRSNIAKIVITLPPSIKEQTAIAKILSDMDEEIEILTTKLNKYKAIKQGMMQELLTGKRRLV